MVRFTLSALTAAALADPALARETVPSNGSPPASVMPETPAAPDRSDGRYSVHRIQDALVRLDGRTGQVSVCSQSTSGWSCHTVPDDRQALENEITRLHGENAMLKKELLSRNLPLPDGVRPPPVAKAEPPAAAPNRTPQAVPETRIPTEAELDRVLSFLTKAWRRMVEMMAEVQRDMDRNMDRKNSGRQN